MQKKEIATNALSDAGGRFARPRQKKPESHEEAFAYLQARGAVRLARAYAGISSRQTRNALLVLIEALKDK